MFQIERTQEMHLAELQRIHTWGITLKELEFQEWFWGMAKDPFTGLWDRKPVGCAYLECIWPDPYHTANVHIWGSAKRIRDPDPHRVMQKMREVLRHWFVKHTLNKLEGMIEADNLGAIYWAKRFGFQQEGFLRQHKLVNGGFKDFVLLSLLREELD